MKPVLCTEEIARLEDLIEKAGTSKAQLMEYAGEFAAQTVLRYAPERVVVLAGFGNNGGDGWVAADVLRHKGVAVDVVTPVAPDEISGALARHVARRTTGRDVNVVIGPSRDELVSLLEKADVVLDAILGTGFSGPVRAPFSIWIPALNEVGATVVSVDVPSGLNAETGTVEGPCVRATTTATMLVPKIGLYSADGPEYAGEVTCGELYDRLGEVIRDVEHAADIVQPADLIDYIPELPANVNKYSRGSVLVVAGSAAYPGAAILAAKAALRAGAGYVAVAAPDACANLIRMALPCVPVTGVPSDARGSFGSAAASDVRALALKFDCILCGPGITTAAGSMQVVNELLGLDIPLVLDADALNCMSLLAIDGIDKIPELYRRDAPLILTPHHRELSRLVGNDHVDDLGTSIDAAQRLVWAAGSEDIVVVAKGASTAIVGVERVLLPMSGPASLATAGSGDVLAGIIAATVAVSRDVVDRWELSCAYAVAVHSHTGYAAASVMGERSVIATDLIDCMGDAMRLVESEALRDSGVEAGE